MKDVKYAYDDPRGAFMENFTLSCSCMCVLERAAFILCMYEDQRGMEFWKRM